MIFKFSAFVGCFLIFYIIGDLFARKYYTSLQVNLKYFKASDSVVLGIFLFGSFTFIFNFFHKVNSIFFYIVIFLFFAYLFFKIKNYKPNFSQLKNILIFSFFLFVLTLGLEPGYDAGYYHVPHQNIVREDKIVFGLSNFHHVFGKSSFYSYLAAPLWMKNNLINLANIQVIFFSYLLLFLYEISKGSRERGIFVLLILFTIPFWLKLAPIKWGLVDFPFGVVFFLSIIYSILIFSSKDKHEIKHFFLISIFLNCLAFFLKPTGFIIGFLTLVNIYFVLKKNILNFSNVIKFIIFPTAILLLWLLKGFINTSCFIYPFPFSCVDTSWGTMADAKINLAITTKWSSVVFDLIKNNYNFSILNFLFILFISILAIIFFHNLFTKIKFKISNNIFFTLITIIFISELIFFNKEINFERENLTFVKILNQFLYFVSLTIIYYLVILFSFDVKKINLKTFNFEIIPLIFSIFIIISWLISAPIPRLAFSFFGAFFASFFFLIKKDNFLNINYRLNRKLIRFCLVSLTLSYSFFLDYDFKNLNLSNIYPPNIETQPRYSFGVKPVNGDQCWNILWCSPQDKKEVKMYEFKTYKFFIK